MNTDRVVAVLVPRGSSAEPAASLPPIVDAFTRDLVREVLVRVFGRPLPGAN